jgi:hypothetical protein
MSIASKTTLPDFPHLFGKEMTGVVRVFDFG